jgi:hypothetical protein
MPLQRGARPDAEVPEMTMHRRRWVWRALASMAGVAALSAGALVWFNSAAWPRRSPADVPQRVDAAIARVTAWMIEHPEPDNSALVHMISEMAELTDDSRLRSIRDRFLNDKSFDRFSLWHRLVDPDWPTIRPALRRELDVYQEYQRWALYGAAPDYVELTADERENLFSPDKYWWGRRTHQLFALLLYRTRKPETPGLTSLIDTLSVGIAREQRWDGRVTDLYIQRIAFLLSSGRPDLVQRRWVERMLDNQQPDGGWCPSWHGLGPGAFQFTLSSPRSTSHSTVQAAWALYLLKYRYPGWFTRS